MIAHMIAAARKALKISAVAAALAAGVGGLAWAQSARPHRFELSVFATPGSPSLFVRTADDERILIDGGANAEIVRRLTAILPFYSRRIDLVVSTGDDPKRAVGLIEVARRYSVARTVSVATSSSIYEGDGASLRMLDAAKGIALLTVGAERLLILPFNPANASKRMLAEARPTAVIYSAAKEAKPASLAGVMLDRRFNIRDTGAVRASVSDGRLSIEAVE